MKGQRFSLLTFDPLFEQKLIVLKMYIFIVTVKMLKKKREDVHLCQEQTVSYK